MEKDTPGKHSLEVPLKLVWQNMSVVPATREAEVGGLLEPRSSSPDWATQ
jgi:hypothetical protein